jgi:hypothetical protein
MTAYARMAGRKKYPGHRQRRVIKKLKATPPRPEPQSTLVAVGSKINGVVKSAISPEILAKTEGMGWHQRRAKIHALTGIPFAEIPKDIDGQNVN